MVKNLPNLVPEVIYPKINFRLLNEGAKELAFYWLSDIKFF